MKPVIVTAATMQELSILIAMLEGKERFQSGHREAYRGGLDGREVILAVTGMGKVNAAMSATALLERFDPELLINTGCAGAYGESDLAVGDLAMASTEVMGDEGVLAPDGWHSLEYIGIPSLERKGEAWFNSFPLTRWALDKAAFVAASAGIPLSQGVFVTVSTVSGTLGRGEELSGRFGGICENMEGGAVAQAALLYGVDCMELRGVSNRVEDRDPARWDIPLAVGKAQEFIARFIGALCETD